MPRLLVAFVLALFCASYASAQSPNRVSIKGFVADSTGEKIAFATVMLLSPADSTLVNFTRTDDAGAFSFKNVPNNPYLLKISVTGLRGRV